MKYFTEAWRSGDLPDAEVARLQEEYLEYIEQNKSSFPPSIRLLATEVNLHDGLFTAVRVDQAANTISMSVIIGDLQAGYEDLDVKYFGVDFARLSIDYLRLLATSDETEFLYDEIEDLGNGNYEHRISFWPDNELSIQFRAAEIGRHPRKNRRRTLNGSVFCINT